MHPVLFIDERTHELFTSLADGGLLCSLCAGWVGAAALQEEIRVECPELGRKRSSRE